jgi:nucleoside-triphosphatase THEP1
MGQLTSEPPLFILSGPREIGVLSPAVFENGIKTGIDILDIRSGISHRLANLRQNENVGIFTERWVFSQETLTWGNEVLAASTPCDLLIVDELGPIELESGGGWQNGILALSTGQYRAAVVVIRPELLDKAFKLWPTERLMNLKKGQNSSLMEDEILTVFR